MFVNAYFHLQIRTLLETSIGELMKLRPLHDRVIVKRLENETKTASGIYIPDNAEIGRAHV